MKPPKTPVEFDYVLWTTKDSRSMVRVKSTGDVTEVSKETLRFLRAEEKRIRRSAIKIPFDCEQETISLTDISVDDLPSEKKGMSSWLIDPADFTQEIITTAVEQEFCTSFTLAQKRIYNEVRGHLTCVGVTQYTTIYSRNKIALPIGKWYFCRGPPMRFVFPQPKIEM